jgi:hypothetical protein
MEPAAESVVDKVVRGCIGDERAWLFAACAERMLALSLYARRGRPQLELRQAGAVVCGMHGAHVGTFAAFVDGLLGAARGVLTSGRTDCGGFAAVVAFAERSRRGLQWADCGFRGAVAAGFVVGGRADRDGLLFI